MNKRIKSLAARTKKLMASMVVLLIFAFPAVLSARWVYDVFSDGDPRSVYSSKEIAEFKDRDCVVDIEDIKPFDEPLITITFDDGWESIYSQGFQVLENNCMKSTQYILGDHYSEINYLSEKQVRSMQASGHEIASHTMTHPNLTTLSGGDLSWELGQANTILDDKFGGVRDFASPLGATNPQVIEEIKKNYRSHRNTVADPATVGDEDINVRGKFDIYQINAYTVRKSTTLEDIQKLIDYTVKRKGWLILTYHQVDDSGAHYAVTQDVLRQQLELVGKSEVRTPVMGQVLDAIEARERGRMR